MYTCSLAVSSWILAMMLGSVLLARSILSPGSLSRCHRWG
jgi:hypothetical protein